MPTPFRCTVVSPQEQVFDEQIIYASIPAWDGQLGVEHLRAPLLVRLGYGPLTITRESGQKDTFYVGGGFAQVKDDVLTLLTDEATHISDLTRSEAEAVLRDAQSIRGMSELDVARRERELARGRAMVALAHGA
jgi:F-type H+-transporting ATPase subunit epsilon